MKENKVKSNDLIDVKVKTSTDGIADIVLSDGTKFQIRFFASNFKRVKDSFDEFGQPIYVFRVSNVVLSQESPKDLWKHEEVSLPKKKNESMYG